MTTWQVIQEDLHKLEVEDMLQSQDIEAFVDDSNNEPVKEDEELYMQLRTELLLYHLVMGLISMAVKLIVMKMRYTIIHLYI